MSGRVGLTLILIGYVIGCGGGDTKKTALPDTVPVTGTVKLDDKPLASAQVIFFPQGETKGTECSGTTDESGKYTLQQLHGKEGAPPGNYKVVVSRFLRPDGTPRPKDGTGGVAAETLPPRYSNISSTTLTATVPAGGGEIAAFELKSK